MIFPSFSFTPAMQLRQSLTGSLTAFWLANLCRLRNFEHTHQEKVSQVPELQRSAQCSSFGVDALQNLNLSQKYPSSLLAVSYGPYGSHWLLRKWASLHRLHLAGWPKKIGMIGMCWVYPHMHCHPVAEIGVLPGIVDLGGVVSWPRSAPRALETFFLRPRTGKRCIALVGPKDAAAPATGLHRTPQFSSGFRVHPWVKKSLQ